MAISRRYWDSTTFLAWLQEEVGRAEACRGVIQAAEAHDVVIVTCALTIAEVFYLRGKDKVNRAGGNKIIQFFQNDFITPIPLDRLVAEDARELLQSYNFLRPNDAIHIATALRYKILIFDTFDTDLIKKLDGKLGDPSLRIFKPNLPYQEEMPLEE